MENKICKFCSIQNASVRSFDSNSNEAFCSVEHFKQFYEKQTLASLGSFEQSERTYAIFLSVDGEFRKLTYQEKSDVVQQLYKKIDSLKKLAQEAQKIITREHKQEVDAHAVVAAKKSAEPKPRTQGIPTLQREIKTWSDAMYGKGSLKSLTDNRLEKVVIQVKTVWLAVNNNELSDETIRKEIERMRAT